MTSFEETVALQALLRQSTGASLDRTDAVQWTSSNTAIARVTANGIVTGRRNGSVLIAATLDSLTAARAMTIAVPTRIVIDEPVTATLIPFNPRFRWHVEHPEPDAEYRVRIYVDKGGYGCDRGGEAVHDAGTGQCATIELSRVAFGLGESAAFAVYADSSTGAAFCGEVFLRVSPPMPLRPPDPACPVAPRSTR